jgi:hypothetical protein
MTPKITRMTGTNQRSLHVKNAERNSLNCNTLDNIANTGKFIFACYSHHTIKLTSITNIFKSPALKLKMDLVDSQPTEEFDAKSSRCKYCKKGFSKPQYAFQHMMFCALKQEGGEGGRRGRGGAVGRGGYSRLEDSDEDELVVVMKDEYSTDSV